MNYKRIFLLVCAGSVMSLNGVIAGTPFHVGVMDTGIVENDSAGLSRTTAQFCSSASDIRDSDGTYYSRLSTCKNANANSSSSAKLPRLYTYLVPGIGEVSDVAGDRHGSDVLRVIRDIDTRIPYVVANTSVCVRQNGLGNPECGLLYSGGTNYNLARSTDIVYRTISSSTFSSLLSRTSRLGAINISYGDRNFSSCPSSLDNTFFQLRNIQKAPVVAATGNGGNRTKPAFPACAPDVISVATTQRKSGSAPPLLSSTAVWDVNTEFFAEGYFIPYDGAEDPDIDGIPNSQEVGSSYAAPRVSAAFAILRGENALSSIDELKQALVSASFDLGLDVNACRDGVCQKFPFVNNNVR